MLNNGFVINARISIGSVPEHAHVIMSRCIDPQGAYVCIANVHMVTEAQNDRYLKSILDKAFLVTPDGQPLAWCLKQQGMEKAARVTGTDLTLELCKLAAKQQISVGFYGSTKETLEALKDRLSVLYPSLRVAFYESPPLLPLEPSVDSSVVDFINKSGAKIVFVGLGCPKQEYWMAAYAPHVSAVLIGIGAAFNFISGTVKRAPVWLQNIGMEWLHRLCMEPGKTWKRYATTNPMFIWLVMKEYLRKK